MTIYRRHMRYTHFDRLRHSNQFLSFLSTQAARLAGTGAGTAVTFANATNEVGLVGHGYSTGQGPFLFANTGGALPAELDDTTGYFVNVVDVDTFTLHLTAEDADAGANVVEFTDDGTGTNEILKGADEVTIFNAMDNGYSADQIRAMTDIDNL